MKRTAAQAFGPIETKRPLVDYDESSDEEKDEPQHAAEEAFGSEEEDEPPRAGEEAFNLEALRKALPWAEYEGMPQEQFAVATQQTGGNPLGPLFEFEFSPVSKREWLKRVEKTIYHSRLRERRLPQDSDDIGVAIVNALETATGEHLAKIGASPEDRVFLTITPQSWRPTLITKG